MTAGDAELPKALRFRLAIPKTPAPRLGLFYAAVFLEIGVTMPFFALWLDASGLGADDIALTLAAPQFLRIVTTPVIAYLADRLGARKPVLVACLAASVTGFVALGVQRALWPIVLLYAVASACLSAAMPLAEAASMRLATEGRIDYGRVRLWGSLTFILASVLGGWYVQVFAAGHVVWLVAAAAGLALLTGSFMPGDTARARPRLGAFRAVAAPKLLMLFLGGSLVQASHAVYYAFSSLQWHEEGLPGSLIGALWAWAVVSEVILFWASKRLFAGFGPAVPLGLGAAAGAARWAAMSLEPPLGLLILLQAGHALSFAAAHFGAVQAASQVRPELQATAQSLYAALNGLAMAGATTAAGPLYRAFGPGAYLGAAGLALMGLVLILGVRPDGPRAPGGSA